MEQTILLPVSLRLNDRRANTAVIVIWAVIATELISLTFDFMQYALLQRAAAGTGISEEEVQMNDLCQQAVGIIYLLVYIASTITFIRWFRRAYYNLHLVAKPLLFDEGWAAGSWFTPILNLFRPYQIMKELYVETTGLLNAVPGAPPAPKSRLLGAWWALWLLSGFLGQYVLKASLHAETLHELTSLTEASIVNSLLGSATGLLLIKIIRDYASLELRLRDLEKTPLVTAGNEFSGPDSGA